MSTGQNQQRSTIRYGPSDTGIIIDTIVSKPATTMVKSAGEGGRVLPVSMSRSFRSTAATTVIGWIMVMAMTPVSLWTTGPVHAFSPTAGSGTRYHIRQSRQSFQGTLISSSLQSKDDDGSSSRRDFLEKAAVSFGSTATVFAAAGGTILRPEPALAADDDKGDDLTQQLFNADGSLKEGVESQLKFRNVKFTWNPPGSNSNDDGLSFNRDGKDIAVSSSSSSSPDDKKLKISYEYPVRWSDGTTDGDPIYFDRSEGTNAKACKRITVYRSPGKVDPSTLEKAAKIGVATAFNIPKGNKELDLDRLYGADIISAKTTDRGENTYYEFDMASAPTTCGNSKENLGLGFCPYDLIVSFVLFFSFLENSSFLLCFLEFCMLAVILLLLHSLTHSLHQYRSTAPH